MLQLGDSITTSKKISAIDRWDKQCAIDRWDKQSEIDTQIDRISKAPMGR